MGAVGIALLLMVAFLVTVDSCQKSHCMDQCFGRGTPAECRAACYGKSAPVTPAVDAGPAERE